MAPPPRPTWEELVTAWQGRIYALARRVTGNATDAEDATQDAFVRIFQQYDRYDPRRPLAPWVYRVALNAIRNRQRAVHVRRRGRVDLAPDLEPARQEEGVVERAEAQQVVERHLGAVDAEARAVVLLTLDAGLTKTEVAEVLGVPRTTVQSRFERALDDVRKALLRSGHLALAPAAGELLTGLPSLEVPAHLTRSLLAVPSLAAVAPATALALGGLLMSKKLVLAAVLLAVLAVGGGYVAGRATAPDVRGAAANTAASRDAEVARLLATNDRLQRQIDELRRLGSASPGSGGTTGGAGGPRLRGSDPRANVPEASPTSVPEVAAAGTPDATHDAKPAISWAPLERLMEENRELLLGAPERDGDAFTPEEQRRLYAILAELSRVSAEAHGLSPYPFFDARVLPGYVRAIFGPALELGEADREAVADATRQAVEREAAGFDPASALPLERYERRRRVAAAVLEAARAAIPADKQAQLAELQRRDSAEDQLLDGSRRTVVLGIGTTPDYDRVAGSIVGEWAEAYGLDERQRTDAQAAAVGFARAADTLLSRAGIVDADQTWQPKERPELADALLHAQMDAEREFLTRLPAAQLDKAKAGPPTILRFDRTQGSSVSIANGGGI